MYLVIELHSSEPTLCRDEHGEIHKFDNVLEAWKYARSECQHGVVLDTDQSVSDKTEVYFKISDWLNTHDELAVPDYIHIQLQEDYNKARTAKELVQWTISSLYGAVGYLTFLKFCEWLKRSEITLYVNEKDLFE